jgi:hypothetical protein
MCSLLAFLLLLALEFMENLTKSYTYGNIQAGADSDKRSDKNSRQ